MINQGLKNYSKQLTQAVGKVAEVHVNVNEDAANLIITIPLLKTLGPNPMEFALYYNYQNRDVVSAFGKGMALNYHKSFREDGTGIYVTNADGSTDLFTYQSGYYRYFNEELNCALNYEEDDEDGSYQYRLQDKLGNSFSYYSRSGDEGYFYFHNQEKMIFSAQKFENYREAQVVIEKTDQLVNKMTYKQDNETRLEIIFGYENQQLQSIRMYQNNTKISEFKMNWASNQLTVEDGITKDSMRYDFENDRVIRFIDGFNGSYQNGQATNITYNGHKTTIQYDEDHEDFLYFDSDQLPLFKADSFGNLLTTEYDAKTKKFLSSSSVFAKTDKQNVLFKGTVLNFTDLNNVEPSSCADTALKSVIDKVYRVTGPDEAERVIHTNGLATDSIMAYLFGHQETDFSEDACVQVGLYLDNICVCQKVFNKPVSDSYFTLMTLGGTSKESFSTVKLVITLKGNVSIEIGKIEILKKDFGTIYQYDEQGNVIGSADGTGSTSLGYDSENYLTSIVGFDSTAYDYQYDKNGNMIHAKGAFGTTIENTYDNNRNLTRHTMSNGDKSKILETRQSYSADGKYLISEEDALGNTTHYTYEDFGKIFKVMNALGTVMEYKYNDFDGLINVLLNQSIQATYAYDNNQRITSITLSNKSKYEFIYTNQFLTSIKLNGTTIVSYEYDEVRGLINAQEYLDHSRYVFHYDQNNQVESVSFYSGETDGPSEQGITQYYFEYNTQYQLTKVKNDKKEIINSFEYDNDGNIISDSGNNFKIKYQYDELGLLCSKAMMVNDIYKNVSFQRAEQASGGCPEAIDGIYQKATYYFGTMFNGNAILKNKSSQIEPYQNSNSNFKVKNRIPCLILDRTSTLSYQLPFSNFHALDSNCVGYWFYLGESNQEIRYLFNLKNQSNHCEITVYIDERDHMVLELVDEDNEYYYPITTHQTYRKNEWNFFGLTWMNRQDENNMEVYGYALFLNDEYHYDYAEEKPYNVWFNRMDLYCIGHRYQREQERFLNIPITALIIGAKKYMTIDEMKEYYALTKEYLNSTPMTTGTTLYTTKYNSSFDIYPLHNSVVSFKGSKPVAYDLRSVSDKDKNRSFVYDNDVNRFVYKADGNTRLEYNFNMGTLGTIMMRAKIMEETPKQYILECKDTHGHIIGLYRDPNRYLVVDLDGYSYQTKLYFSPNCWHTVGISFIDEAIYDQDITIIKTIRVYLDGQTKTFEQEVSDFYQNVIVSIGRSFNLIHSGSNLGDVSSYCPLNGLIEMMAIKLAFCEKSTLDNLSEELKSFTKTREYDELGILQKTIIHQAEKPLVTNSYTYKTKEDEPEYCSTCINRELISYRNGSADRYYTTNEIGNVTLVLDSVFGRHSYEYNSRGFLIKENNTAYEYDGNGNMTKAGTKTFVYDSNMKDKLIQVDGTDITYKGLNPSQWGHYNYTFEGRRLVKLEYKPSDAGITGEDQTITYTYNDKGLRLSKTVNDDTTNYYYDGDKLIKEVGPNYRLDFLYDEHDLLYGFIKNNCNPYFYVRDFMQNILGIVDKNGYLVVKYNCNAWGDHSVLDDEGNVNTTSTFIGNINPFRYKGYYYDRESNIYYCKSRYYNPEWCRWLNADSVSCLDYQNINQMNLFAYCSNNPVMGIDPTGQFALLVSILVGAVIGFACSYIPDVASNFKDGFDWSDFNTFEDNWIKYVGATVGGAIGGLGTGIGTTMLFGGVGNVVSGIFNGSVTSFSDGAVQFALGALTSGLSYGISKGISNKLGAGRISKIIGSSSKNSKINANLAKNNFGNLKVGKLGMGEVVRKLYKELGYENIQDGIGYALDFGFGFLF